MKLKIKESSGGGRMSAVGLKASVVWAGVKVRVWQLGPATWSKKVL
jgi:hypothetical protein